MFCQIKGTFVRQIEIKKGHPKGGKNACRTWAAAVLSKLEAEAALEGVRNYENLASRSGELQYFFQAMIVYVSTAAMLLSIANLIL